MDHCTITFNLLSAVREGKLETVKQSVSSFGVSYSKAWSDGYTLLRDAIEKGHAEIAKLLLLYGSKVNSVNKKSSNTPLHFAVLNGDIEIVEMLLDRGANIEAKGKNTSYPHIRDDYTPLHLAVENGNEEIVKLLLSRGANVNAKGKDGLMALHVATLQGHKEVVDVLLKCGAGIDSKDKDDRTALHISTRRYHLEMVEVLLKFGADIDSKDKDGRTALHIASECEYVDIVKVLLKFGANINSKDKYGKTALHIASKNGHVKIINTLLEHGSDINVRCTSNYTALDLAMFCDIYNHSPHEYKDVIQLFKNHIIKAITANLYVNKRNLLLITKNDKIIDKDFQKDCEKEIASMKSEKINNNCNISFYDILTKNINQLAIYAGNENIIQVLKSDNYKIKFPIYFNILNSRFGKGERRREFLKQNNKIFHFFSKNFGLPQECTEKIFSYLSNEDLRVLKDAY